MKPRRASFPDRVELGHDDCFFVTGTAAPAVVATILQQ
jgi:hypothetical protein